MGSMVNDSAASIGERIEADVNSGRIVAGDQLPPIRDFAAELGVSPSTVAAAYRNLRDRGIVVGKGRQGTRVAPTLRRSGPPTLAIPDDVVDALSGSPDPSLLPPLGPAFAYATRGRQGLYGDALLDDEFGRAARAIFELDGIDASHLTATSGAMDAIERVIAAQGFRKGDRIGVEDPGHIPMHQLVRSAGLVLVPIPVDEQGITVEGLKVALSSRIAALIVTPRSHNPTGAALTIERAKALSAVLADHPDVVLVADDHAGPISGVDYVAIAPPGERHATIRSLGKTYGPDLRISVMVSDQRTADRVAVSISNGPGWVSHIVQRAAAFLLGDTATAAVAQSAALTYGERRHRLIAALADHGVAASGPSGLNVWIPTDDDEQALIEAARLAGYAIRGADAYRIDSGPAVRITISNLSDEDIDNVADAIGAAATESATRTHSVSI